MTSRRSDGRRIVLASASPRRKSLLEEAGFDVFCHVSGADEIEGGDFTAAELALANARLKIARVASLFPDEVVLAADTVVTKGGLFYGKPRDIDDARRILSELSGSTHEVVTGFVLALPGGRMIESHETTRVRFHPLGPAEIDAYLSSINPMDKAGAYAAQDDNGRIIASIEGLFSNVVGLPVERVAELLTPRE